MSVRVERSNVVTNTVYLEVTNQAYDDTYINKLSNAHITREDAANLRDQLTKMLDEMPVEVLLVLTQEDIDYITQKGWSSPTVRSIQRQIKEQVRG